MKAGHIWLASFLVFPLVGAPFLSHRAFEPFGCVGRLVLSGAVGAVLLSSLMTAWAVPGWTWNLAVLIPLGVLLSFGLRLVVGQTMVRPRADYGTKGLERLLTGLAIVIAATAVACAFLATAAAKATSSDLILVWGPKAEQFAAARIIDVDFMRSPYLSYMNHSYPPLVPNLYAFATMIAGRLAWGAATLTFPLLLAAIAIALPGVLGGWPSRLHSFSVSALLVGVISLIGIHTGIAGNGDMPLFFFETLALAILLRPEPISLPLAALSGLLFAGASAAKVEGFPFVVAAVLFLPLACPSLSARWKTLAWLLVPSGCLVAAWWWFGYSRGLFHGYQGFNRVSAVRLSGLSEVSAEVLKRLAEVDWGLPYIIPFLVFLALPWKTRRAVLPLCIAVALTGFFVFTYLLTPAVPVHWIMWSAPRVFGAVAMAVALAVFSAGQSPDTLRSATDAP